MEKLPQHDGNAERYAAFCKALGDPTRLKLFHALSQKPRTPVSELAETLGASINTISMALGKLRSALIVTCERSGKSRLYSLNLSYIQQVLQAMLNEIPPARGKKKKK